MVFLSSLPHLGGVWWYGSDHNDLEKLYYLLGVVTDLVKRINNKWKFNQPFGVQMVD